ncbi:Hvo_1808 family surface protein [Halopelagius fulvigenes]|uniref:Hvo_1808 family surface protein n=1 Tax=Halopelagius fulvigenes TaxID=1198324 RepID=A0ABD5TUJ7_9EURY
MNVTRVRVVAVLAALTLVLSGCAAPVADPTPNAWRWPEDPKNDRLGWEAGYWYNESIDVDQSDGLNASEREAFVGRTMARVERIRGLEFEESVEVAVMSRAEYRNRSNGGGDDAGPGWNDQVWEALLLIGENRTVESTFDELYGDAVLGYYSPSEERIVVVSDAENPVIDRATLSHELMHALQYQQFEIDGAPQTLDGRLAEDGLVEGDARYVERLYERRCGGEWDCIRRPDTNPNRENFDFGVYLTVYTPYSEGPTLVDSLRERGGWAAVNEAYASVPASTEQLVHPEAYPEDRPLTVGVPDRSNGAWSRFDRDPVGNTVGEAPIFVMLYRHGAIPSSSLERNPGAYSRYDYAANESDGWAGDTVVPYRSDDGEFGYVWATEWETAEDAEEFRSAYETALREGLNATRTGPNTYVVADGPYADAFRVTREGTRVTVVNAPTTDQLDGVHAPDR